VKSVNDILDSVTPEGDFSLRKIKPGTASILSTKEEKLLASGDLTVEEMDFPEYQKVQVIKELYQNLVGPNHVWYFTPNVEKIMREAKFTSVDLFVWNRILRKLWYYNYICISQVQFAKLLELNTNQISLTLKKFREFEILETVEPLQKIPKEVAGIKGTWYRVSIDMVWLGPVWALERCPENYKLLRRKTAPKQMTRLDSFWEMKQKNRINS